jgi:hypothetical protein
MSRPTGRDGWLVAAVVAGVVGGCAAELPQTATGPHPPVVTRTDPATAAMCPYGGAVVRSGLDENGNHALDDDEILASTVTCNTEPDQPAPVVLVRLDAEPPGVHCVDGGTAIRSGLDRNRDGVLDDREVTEIDYVCGETLLTRLAAEPAGVHCAAGGIAFLTGRDRDGDAVLEDGEVEHTEYECGDEIARSVTIASPGELATLSHIRAIGGSLVILDPGPVSDLAFEEVALPALEQVGGGVRISAIKFLARIALPRLQQVGAAAEILDNSLLTAVAWAELAHVGGALEISRNPQLLEIAAFPPLASVDGDCLVRDNPALQTVELPADVRGRIEITGNSVLAALAIAASDRTTAIRVADNGVQHVTIAPSAATTANAAGVVPSVEILDNPRLAVAEVTADQLAGLVVARNPALEQLAVFATEIAGRLEVTGNPALTAFDPSQLTRIAGAIEISDNAALPVIALPALPAAGDIHIARNAALGRVGLAALTQADTIAIDDNPWLPSCAVAALFAHVEASSLEQNGNDDAAVCRR